MPQKRQFVTDESGNPIAVILPLADYARVKSVLESVQGEEDKLRLMQEAAADEAFLNDLTQTMQDFRHVDTDWWEPIG